MPDISTTPPRTERPSAVITGASSGIGRGIALHLAHAGWNIAFTHVGAHGAAADVAAALRAAGADVLFAECDAGDKAQVDRFFGEVAAWCGAPALLVNNAGIQTWAPLLDLAEADWDRVITTNLKGCFLNTQAAARLMRERGGGRIVNIGSGSNKLAFPHLVDYTASKGGIEQFTKVAAVELGPFGITVNCVAPGAIELERTRQEAPGYGDTWAAVTPLGRVGQVEDVAGVVAFFASPAAAFVTGQTIWVDGGVFTRATWPYAQA
ncbi:SDR family NAD(P)-dependent oxidoreductase [Niveibacterium microcysteis]|uniref:SDR family oxidoreductase n=1 Tax=Niveibacterium microcysteis TaxID=2811415 RepID=A0ABX7M4Y3_9RHOO|nr:SDR family NAD(P)-dependent oxidoreductase [Niveibacterium microcysteis]QSI76807.1 SDR family oxidoreductase [Niveibacterium microcysteis]